MKVGDGTLLQAEIKIVLLYSLTRKEQLQKKRISMKGFNAYRSTMNTIPS